MMPFYPVHALEERIAPVAERVGADGRYAGRGVTIAFLDAGFYAHPDLTTPSSRIGAYHNVLTGESGTERLAASEPSAWHGLMTSAVCAGNGSLSQGYCQGLAHESHLVLVKVGHLSRIAHDDIARGIEWVIAHREHYNIRILNISCGGDYEKSYLHDHLSQRAEEAVRAGIVVVCAAGNCSYEQGHRVVPPASAPGGITIGGINDGGNPQSGCLEPYSSSYGPTIDGLQKPEIVAPAQWIAAPILPDTPTSAEAQLLHNLASISDDALLERALHQAQGISQTVDEARGQEPSRIRHMITARMRDQKVIHAHYQHVDGTSFAAAVVSSVVAQMLEANPSLAPHTVKRILIDTALRLPHVPVEQQGWGLVQASAAVREAEARKGLER